MIHCLDSETMAYTGCFRLPDNGSIKLTTTGDVNKVTCPDCIDAILAEWEEKHVSNQEF